MVGVLLAAQIVLAPPSNFLPYRGPLVRIVRPLDKVNRICRAFADRGTAKLIFGCQFLEGLTCVEIIADVPERQQIEDHEDAHCNGWRHE